MHTGKIKEMVNMLKNITFEPHATGLPQEQLQHMWEIKPVNDFLDTLQAMLQEELDDRETINSPENQALIEAKLEQMKNKE